MKLFFLISDTDTGDAIKQIALLASGLLQERFEVAVGVLGSATGPACDALRAAGAAVCALPLRHVLDFSGMRRLRHAVRAFGAPVLHAFGADAVRVARVCVLGAGDGNEPRFVASGAVNSGGGIRGWFATRQVRRADRVIATGWAEAERYREAGVSGERLTRIAPAVALPPAAPDRAGFCRAVGAPDSAQLILVGGRLDLAHGLKDAVTAFDMLRYLSPVLNLVFTDSGVDRGAAEDLGRALAFDDFRIRFAGPHVDSLDATGLAAQVWVLCAFGGEHRALRAMAAGRPVLAFRTPELEEIIDDGETGYLIPPGDRTGLATMAQELLADAETAARVGEAARARVAERFGPARFVDQHARVYQELVG